MRNAEGAYFHSLIPELPDAEGRGDFPRIHIQEDCLTLTYRIPRSAKDYKGKSPLRRYGSWETLALTFSKSGAGQLNRLAGTDGGNCNDSSFLEETDGSSLIYSTDGRFDHFPDVEGFTAPIERKWILSKLDLPKSEGFPELIPGELPAMEQAWDKAFTQGIPYEDRDPEALFGDLHRHTELSRCAGRKDGVFLDALRYARGPGGLDFLAITDHLGHMTPWSLWQQLRDIERWNAPGSLALLPAFERIQKGLGHQNFVFENIDAAAEFGFSKPTSVFPLGEIIAIPHMTADARHPFDWRLFDPEIHRLVEIHQGKRGSYEGGVSSEGSDKRSLGRGGEMAIWPLASLAADQEVGWVNHLPMSIESHVEPPGLISSSDHASSLSSFAGISLGPFSTREITTKTIFDHLYLRKTFGTTNHSHRAQLSFGKEENGRLELKLHTDSQSLGSVTVFGNGEEIRWERKSTPMQAPGHILVRPFFPSGRPWKFVLRGENLSLSAPKIKQPHPLNKGSFASYEEGGGIELNEDSFATGLSGLVFATQSDGAEPPSISFSYAQNGVSSTAVDISLSLEMLQETSARRIWFSRQGSEPFVQVLWLGNQIPISAWKVSGKSASYLPLPLGEQPSGVVYYARVTWLDGHVAWTRMIRR
ncbi:MAG: hypothetical protein COA70_07380 [Planctomycetota bacterium]|nr:MAG: hypothetical protein COA70_07380 [Planctomycetota bacterium]